MSEDINKQAEAKGLSVEANITMMQAKLEEHFEGIEEIIMKEIKNKISYEALAKSVGRALDEKVDYSIRVALNRVVEAMIKKAIDDSDELRIKIESILKNSINEALNVSTDVQLPTETPSGEEGQSQES